MVLLMAFRCPVCASLEVDGEHLANHLAFTAVIRGDDHEGWLDEHVSGWSEMGPGELAPLVVEAVPAVDVPEVDAEDADGGGGHAHEGGGRLEEALARQGSHRGPGSTSSQGRGDLSEEAAGVMAEAREMTKAMYGLDGDDADGGETEDEGTGGENSVDAVDSEDAAQDPDAQADDDSEWTGEESGSRSDESSESETE